MASRHLPPGPCSRGCCLGLVSQTERDVSVRQRAVDLLYAMCDRSNAQQIVAEMLSYLETADYSIREEIVSSGGFTTRESQPKRLLRLWFRPTDFFFASQDHTCDIRRFPGEGWNRSCSRRPPPQPQQHGVRAVSAACTTARGNAGSFNPLSEAWELNPRPHGCQSGSLPLSHDGNSVPQTLLQVCQLR